MVQIHIKYYNQVVFRTWENQSTAQRQHEQQHNSKLSLETFVPDHSCIKCWNTVSKASKHFKNFFYWLKNYYGTVTFSKKTTELFNEFIQAYQKEIDYDQKETHFSAAKLLTAIKYKKNPVITRQHLVAELIAATSISKLFDKTLDTREYKRPTTQQTLDFEESEYNKPITVPEESDSYDSDSKTVESIDTADDTTERINKLSSVLTGMSESYTDTYDIGSTPYIIHDSTDKPIKDRLIIESTENWNDDEEPETPSRKTFLPVKPLSIKPPSSTFLGFPSQTTMYSTSPKSSTTSRKPFTLKEKKQYLEVSSSESSPESEPEKRSRRGKESPKKSKKRHRKVQFENSSSGSDSSDDESSSDDGATTSKKSKEKSKKKKNKKGKNKATSDEGDDENDGNTREDENTDGNDNKSIDPMEALMGELLKNMNRHYKSNRGREKNLMKPNKFAGNDSDDSYEWIEAFERIAEANNWNDKDWVGIAVGFFTKAAAQWYEENRRNIPATRWFGDKGFRIIFLHKFASKTKQGQWHRQFKNCSQGEDSVAEYTVTFRNLWNRCDPRHKIPLPSIIADYTTGLRDDIAIFVHASNSETLE